MTSGQSTEMTAARLLAAADEALIEAGFRTGEFDEAERLSRAAAERAAKDGDQAGATAAAGLLGQVMHSRNIRALMNGGTPEPDDVLIEEEQYTRALAGYKALGDEAGIARAAFGLGVFEQVLHQDWD